MHPILHGQRHVIKSEWVISNHERTHNMITLYIVYLVHIFMIYVWVLLLLRFESDDC